MSDTHVVTTGLDIGPQLAANLAITHRWLRDNNVSLTMSLFKLSEEVGEVSQAYTGVCGANPRKGTTHTWDDVADEVSDVAITALNVLAAMNRDPLNALNQRLQFVVERIEAGGDL